MSKKTGKVQAVGSRNDGEFGILLDDDEWYNGNGSRPDLNEGDEVTVEFDLEMNDGDEERWLKNDHDSIEVVSQSSGGSSGGGNGENMSRQKPIEAIGHIYQGNPPQDAKDMNQLKFLLKELTRFSGKGEFKVDIPEDGVGLGEDAEEKLQELSDRLGQIEEAGGPEAASTDEVDDVNERVEELEEQVSNLESLLENTQAALKSLKESSQEEEDDEKEPIFVGGDEDEEDEGEEDAE